MPPKKYKRPEKFKKEWEIKLGVQISAVDPQTKETTSVVCLFCKCLGRDTQNITASGNDRKRKSTVRVHYYSAPFRIDNIRRHNVAQHQDQWESYQKLSLDARKEYFVERESALVINMRSFVQPQASATSLILAKQQCTFIFDAAIINDVIGDLLFDPNVECTSRSGSPEDEGAARKRAMSVFVVNGTSDDEASTYKATIKSVLKLNLIIRFLSCGVSFAQASKLYVGFKEETGMGVLGSINDVQVAQICRIVCAANLQHLKDLCANVWAFSIGLDAGNNAGSSYLDVRIRFYLNGTINNFHILAIPMRERHTGAYQFGLVVTLLNVIAPNWREQLIGIASDGASDMTGCIQGAVTRLCQEAKSEVYRVWCGAHQLDLVMKKAFHKLCDDQFVGILTRLTAHLRRQQNLINDMKTACPTFAETRWISMGKLLKWLKDKRGRLFQHFDDKRPACTPPMYWWIVVYVIQELVERVEKTFAAVQGLNTLVCEQRGQFAKLARDIRSSTKVKGPLTGTEKAEIDVRSIEGKAFVNGDYAVEWDDAISCIEDGGAFVVTEMDKLDDPKKAIVVSTFANFALNLVCGISSIVAERDMQNNAADELPPVLPIKMLDFSSRELAVCLERHKNRLLKLGNDAIEKIDVQLQKMKRSYREEQTFANAIDTYKDNYSFKDCWSPLGVGFEELKSFAGGIATVMPGTSSVESDFSLINWHKDPNTKALTDFSLESILHCKQHTRLGALAAIMDA